MFADLIHDESNLVEYCLKKISTLEIARSSQESIWNATMAAIDPFWVETKRQYLSNGTLSSFYSCNSFSQGKFDDAYKGDSGSLILRAGLELSSQMIDPSVNWLDLVSYSDLKDNEIFQDYLSTLKSSVNEIVSRKKSGFYSSAIPLATFNGFQLACGIVHIMAPSENSVIKRNNVREIPVNFSCVDPRFFVFERDLFGNLVFCAQEYVLSLEAAYSLWGDVAIKNISKNINSPSSMGAFDCVRKYYHVVDSLIPVKKDSRNRWIELIIDKETKKIVSKGFLSLNPYAVWNFLPKSGSNYGISPPYFQSKKILHAEHVVEQVDINMEYFARPVLGTARGADIDFEDIMPNSIVANAISEDGKPLYGRLPIGGDVSSLAELSRLEKNDIADGLIVKSLSQQDKVTGMTETLVAEQRAASDNQMKPIINIWAAQFMTPIIENVIEYLVQRVKIKTDDGDSFSSIVSFPFEELGIEESPDFNPIDYFSIEYGGMLGRQQDRYEDVMMNNALMEAAQICQLFPSQADEIQSMINASLVVREKFKLKHFKSDIAIKSQKQMIEIQKQKQKLAILQQEAKSAQLTAQLLSGNENVS